MKSGLTDYSFIGQDFILRNFEPGDAEVLARHANNSRIAANLRDIFPHPYHTRNAQDFISMVRSSRENLILAIEVDGEACGAIGLNGMEDIYRYNAEIGYWLSEKHWGKGIMPAAVAELLKLGFNRYHWTRIWAGVFVHNLASARVLEKNGFRKEAIHRKAIYKNGKHIDEYVYAILKEDWEKR